jgi:hypothetical protein
MNYFPMMSHNLNLIKQSIPNNLNMLGGWGQFAREGMSVYVRLSVQSVFLRGVSDRV